MSIEGILGRKLGMTQVFEKDGTAVPSSRKTWVIPSLRPRMPSMLTA